MEIVGLCRCHRVWQGPLTLILCSWEDLKTKPDAGQWEYFKVLSSHVVHWQAVADPISAGSGIHELACYRLIGSSCKSVKPALLICHSSPCTSYLRIRYRERPFITSSTVTFVEWLTHLGMAQASTFYHSCRTLSRIGLIIFRPAPSPCCFQANL